ncbi:MULTISPECIES: AraC family transcriptional regulator [unclassified Actinotalea]|uniref:helix-turn-helix domain-containing protein n=1 Tax=unclassified Actinotalea TaxID=2638618 RepID=UPI0015F45568|nr:MULTISPECIES: AraC family transcriptional regulator [unclassified Actinotalea]
MKPDTVTPPGRADAAYAVERAHLKRPDDASHEMFRYPVSPDLADLALRFWIPVWSVPPGEEAPQRVLQYPVCLLVVSADYARFYGPVSGLSTTVLTGDGWAVGVMCRPAAGYLLTGGPVADHTDRHVDVEQVIGAEPASRLVGRVRAAMAGDPRSPDAHRAAMAACEEVLRRHLPVDDEGRLVNRIVDLVEHRDDLTRVTQLCAEVGLSERSLQRLAHRRLGLTPRWLIQRRRLHQATEHLRAGTATLSEVAARLGYADQPHFHHDLVRATGTTPGEFVAQHRRGITEAP